MNAENNLAIENLSYIIAEMVQKGVTRSLDQAKVLKRDYGIKIAPHVLAEFKSSQRKEVNASKGEEL